MAVKLLAPLMGEGIEEVTILNWLKKEGDTVKEFEPVVELETDKVTTDIPSPAAGVILKLYAKINDRVKVGQPLALIGEPGESEDGAPRKAEPVEAVPAAADTLGVGDTPEVKSEEMAEELGGLREDETLADTSKAAKTQSAPATPAETSGPVKASPLVKKLAAEKGIDLAAVKGTGQDGTITKMDIESYEKAPAKAEPAAKQPVSDLDKLMNADLRPAAKPAAQAAVPTAPAAAPAVRQAAPVAVPQSGGRLVPLTSVRRQIAERMIGSKLTSAHTLTVMEADMSKVLAHRKANKEAFEAQGANLTITAYIVAAIVEGLKAAPVVNSMWTDEGIFEFDHINVGVAVSLGDDGLIVPVIKNAEQLSLLGLSKQINDLAVRARTKKLMPDDVRGATFTLTNYGTGDTLFGGPIISQPQVAILGSGAMQKRPVVVQDTEGNDAITIRPMIYLSLMFDHRVMDGSGADAFLKKVKDTLQNWA
ncbi:MAG TPA: dihydrolipoamide acetyltransferase family protein [Bellilinea sp.]|nr:dihydrolipoamide acetyltransferase family protein [Bellilinea sp.]